MNIKRKRVTYYLSDLLDKNIITYDEYIDLVNIRYCDFYLHTFNEIFNKIFEYFNNDKFIKINFIWDEKMFEHDIILRDCPETDYDYIKRLNNMINYRIKKIKETKDNDKIIKYNTEIDIIKEKIRKIESI